MIKKAFAFLTAFAMVLTFAGCNKRESEQSSADVEVIVIEEGDIVMDNESAVSSEQSVSSEQQPVSSASSVVSEEDDDVQDDWRTHPQDFKLLAFTFDDGPSDDTSRWVDLFEAFDGAGTFFVNGTGITGNAQYAILQNAINAGWDVGNHGASHLVATTGQSHKQEANIGKASYDDLKADISDFSAQLKANLKKADGTPYAVSLYRPPNDHPTDISYQICAEDGLAVISKSQDSHDWDSTKIASDVYRIFKNGIGTWNDGDIILSHEWADSSYDAIKELLPDFYRAGYRFCSITDLMKYRGISLSSVTGELNTPASDTSEGGMVTNIIEAANYGKK